MRAVYGTLAISMSHFSLDSQLSLLNDDGSSLLAIRDVQSNTHKAQ